jgi:hypothetical protein
MDKVQKYNSFNYWGVQVKDDETNEAHSTNERDEKSIQNFGWET